MNLYGDFISVETIMMLQYAKRIAYSNEATLMFSHDVALKYKGTNASFVECGTAAGAQIIAMRAASPKTLIHAFDSFQGIPLPSNKDNQYPGIKELSEFEQSLLPDAGKQVLETTGVSSVSVESFKQHLIDSGAGLENIEIHEGWFEETMPTNTVDKICILRLDGDLYNSTWVCLTHLFPKVIKGGCVIVDDWQLKGCRDACDEYFQFIGYEPDYKFISNIAYFYK